MKDSSSQSSALTADWLRDFLTQHSGIPDVYPLLRKMVEAGYGNLPLPGHGRTLGRWQMFATAAQFDLSLAKLYESHADALSILHELERAELAAADSIWGVWCAEPPSHRLRISPTGTDAEQVRIHGRKAWCSGAGHLTHALASAWDDEGRPCLVAVDLGQSTVEVMAGTWAAVGMAATDSLEVVFHDAVGIPVGAPGAYVDRPGFQHGAAGIAACWYGASNAIAQVLLDTLRETLGRSGNHSHALAHLGAIDVALAQAGQQLRSAAAEIDARPRYAHGHAVRRARLAVETAAEIVLVRAPRAFGPAPLCQDPRTARLVADLPVFIRQSHAERDLADHGQALVDQPTEAPWTL